MRFRESVRHLWIYESDEEAAKAEELACELAETYAEELTPAEPDFSCEISCETNRTAEAIPQDAAKEFICAMRLAPNGIQKRNIKMDGFVVVSLNLGVVRTEEDRIVMIFFSTFFCCITSGRYKRTSEYTGRNFWLYSKP